MVGSTRNSILQGTFELNFQEIVTGHVDEVCALATHPQQNQFLTAGYDNLLHLWDTLTHRAVWSSNIGVSESFIEVSVHIGWIISNEPPYPIFFFYYIFLKISWKF